MLSEVKINYSEPLYTLTEANKVLNTRRNYYIKQRFLGIMLIVSGILSMIVLEDITYAIGSIPLGFYFATTIKKILPSRR